VRYSALCSPRKLRQLWVLGLGLMFFTYTLLCSNFIALHLFCLNCIVETVCCVQSMHVTGMKWLLLGPSFSVACNYGLSFWSPAFSGPVFSNPTFSGPAFSVDATKLYFLRKLSQCCLLNSACCTLLTHMSAFINFIPGLCNRSYNARRTPPGYTDDGSWLPITFGRSLSGLHVIEGGKQL